MVDKEIRSIIEQELEKALDLFKKEVKKQLEIQGHRNTGRLEASIDSFVTNTGISVIGTAIMEDYGLKLDTGVKASEIRTTVDYINDLTDYFRSKGYQKQSKTIAIRTALAHKREGRPTKGSYRYSKNGKRTGFVNDAYDNVKAEFEKIITDDLIDKVTFAAINSILNVQI